MMMLYALRFWAFPEIETWSLLLLQTVFKHSFGVSIVGCEQANVG